MLGKKSGKELGGIAAPAPSTLDGGVEISDKRATDPRLRPFIVAMANAIIKDMLREQREQKEERR
jgi:hypothetical protein